VFHTTYMGDRSCFAAPWANGTGSRVHIEQNDLLVSRLAVAEEGVKEGLVESVMMIGWITILKELVECLEFLVR